MFVLVSVSMIAALWMITSQRGDAQQPEPAGSWERRERGRDLRRDEAAQELKVQVAASVGFSVVFEVLAGLAFLALNGSPDARRAAFAWGALGAFAAGAIGILMSQYAPVFGGPVEKYLARPLSPARLGEMPMHTLLFGAVGFAIGAGLSQSRKPAAH